MYTRARKSLVWPLGLCLRVRTRTGMHAFICVCARVLVCTLLSRCLEMHVICTRVRRNKVCVYVSVGTRRQASSADRQIQAQRQIWGKRIAFILPWPSYVPHWFEYAHSHTSTSSSFARVHVYKHLFSHERKFAAGSARLDTLTEQVCMTQQACMAQRNGFTSGS